MQKEDLMQLLYVHRETKGKIFQKLGRSRSWFCSTAEKIEAESLFQSTEVIAINKLLKAFSKLESTCFTFESRMKV